MAAKENIQGYSQASTVPQPQVIMITAPVQNNVSPQENQRYRVKAGQVTGSLHIVFGCISMVLAIVVFYLTLKSYDTFINRLDREIQPIQYVNYYHNGFFIIAWPFWGSLFFYLVTGIVGLHTVKKTKSVIIAYMVMSILASVIAGGQIIVESVAAVSAPFSNCYSYRRLTQSDPYEYNSTSYIHDCIYQVGLVVCHSLAAIIGLAEMVIGIVSAAFCCHGVCCGRPSSQTAVQYTAQPEQEPPSYTAPQPVYQDLVN
ncbi:uncharacterized protein [Amphiura filiformis]|uniref:uncharacterized protein n=1 Tax=Amphiura filiformis TaxID=82378 RepID=UPI003B21D49D